MKNNLEIGVRIRAIREGLHMSRNVFSEKVGISESYLTQLENGSKSLGTTALMSIGEYTGYSTDYILYGKTSDNDYIKKIIRIVNILPEEHLHLAYEMVRSIKAFAKNRGEI